MKRYFNDLKKILAFALIKVAPGLFNVALIPFLVARLRPDAYGNYSLWLSYAMLVATVIGAVVTQPMYRYLSSRPEDRALFDSFMLVAAVAAGAISTAVAVGLNAPGWLPLGYAAFSAGTVLSAGVSVGFQIDRRIGRLALYEGLRVLTIVLPIAAPILMGQALETGHVVLGLALSNFVPLALLSGPLRLVAPPGQWLRKATLYGVKSAAWLLLAGIPVVGSKSILSSALTPDSFGAYSAFADITYRGFGLVNAAVTMWVFPVLSRRFDEGALEEVRHLLRFALSIYALSGAAVLAGALALALAKPDLTAHLSGGLAAIALITLANFAWQGMSIAHKPFELTVRTTRMVLLLAVGVGAFLMLPKAIGMAAAVDPLFAVTAAMAGVAIVYIAISMNQDLGR